LQSEKTLIRRKHDRAKSAKRMTADKPRKRSGRPALPTVPGQRSKIQVLLEPDIKARIDEHARANGTTHSIEGGRYLRLGLEYEARLGGPQTHRRLQLLAELAKTVYDDENEWIGDRDRELEMIGVWHEAMLRLAPPAKITIDEQIAAGRRLVAQLVTTTDPRRQAHLRSLLSTMARVEAFDDATRAEFAQAAVVALPQAAEEPLPPAPARAVLDWAATPADHLNSAWQTARAMVLGEGRRPDVSAIAAYLLDDADLRRIGGVPQAVVTVEELLEYRGELVATPPPQIEQPPPVGDVEVVEPHGAANDTAKSDEPQADDPVEHRLWRAFSMLAHLDPDKFPRRTKAILTLLRLLSKDPSLPTAVRAEFEAITRGKTK
jgi:hypothetical protein